MPSSVPRTEYELVLLMQQDDMGALSEIYYLYVKQLKHYVLKAAKSPVLAEDVIHDTFIKVWENRDKIDPNQSLKAYLFTVAHRHLLNLLKRAQHERGIVAEIQKYTNPADDTTQLLLQYNESNSLLNQAIQELPPQRREVFIRCKIKGHSHKQIAEELNISVSTVNNQIGKALKSINEYLNIRNGLILILLAIMK